MSTVIRIPFSSEFENPDLTPREQYAYGYGAWPEGTLVLDTMGVHPTNVEHKYIDRRRAFISLIRKKAILDTTAAIIHTTTDQQIIDTTRRETPLQELIPMETARGKTASYDVLLSRGTGDWVVETAQLSSASPITDTYKNATQTLAITTATGGWTDFGLAGLASQYPSRDARALEIRNKTWTLNEMWENELINGMMSSPAGYKGGNLSSYGFGGFRATAYNSSGGATGTASDLLLSKGANPLTFGDIDTVVNNMVQQNVKPNLAYTDLITWQYVKASLMSPVRYVNPETEIAWGLRAIGWQTPYGLMPVIADKFAPNLSGFREFGIMDTKFLAQRVLLDATFELLAKTTIQQTFITKKFGCYIDKTDTGPQPNLSGFSRASVMNSGYSKMGLVFGLP